MYSPFVSVIIAAAGSGTRMHTNISKQFIEISNKAIVEYSLIAFSNSDLVKEIIVTTKEEEIEKMRAYSSRYPKVKAVVIGGATRQESVKNALDKVSEKSEYIAIHDAARPLITTKEIDKIFYAAVEQGAVCPVSRIVDTVKRVNDSGEIIETVDRKTLFLASTPQVFKAEIYKKAFESIDDLSSFTDDCSIVEAINQKVSIYVLEEENTKITTIKDLANVKSHLSGTNMRIGHGYDVHRLVEGRRLIIGAVDIPHEKGLLGHSDADVLLHAIMDSLLGAAGLGDIGRHFPDSSNEYKDISSLILLERVGALLTSKGYSISNIDATIIAQAPKISPFIPKMISNISSALNIPEALINVKATTEENLGFTGEKLGISAHSVAIIY